MTSKIRPSVHEKKQGPDHFLAIIQDVVYHGVHRPLNGGYTLNVYGIFNNRVKGNKRHALGRHEAVLIYFSEEF